MKMAMCTRMKMLSLPVKLAVSTLELETKKVILPTIPGTERQHILAENKRLQFTFFKKKIL